MLSALLARERSVHFALNGTVKIEEPSLLSHLHQVPPFNLRAAGDASRSGLIATGSVAGDFSGSGALVVAGKKGYVRAEGAWYSLGTVKQEAELLRGAHWTLVRAADGKPQSLHGELHLSADQVEQLSGLSLPFGIDGAEATVTIHLSRWGEQVRVKAPGSARPLPTG